MFVAAHAAPLLTRLKLNHTAHPLDFIEIVVQGFEVEHLAFLHLIGRKVSAASTGLQTGQSIGVHN